MDPGLQYLPKYINFSENAEFCNIYYNFIPGIDLFTYIFNNIETLHITQIKILIKKMLACLVELKNYNLCHLDIKFENYIYDVATEKLTLIDFESAHPYIKNNALTTCIKTVFLCFRLTSKLIKNVWK